MPSIEIALYKHKMEIKLKESEEKFRNITEKSHVGVYLIQEGIFEYVNPRFAEMLGYSVGEMIGKIKARDVVHREDWHIIIEENKRKKKIGKNASMSYNFRVITKNKEIFFIEVLGARMTYNGKPAIIGTVLDITQRKVIEKTLMESEEKFRMIFENSPLAMVHLNSRGIITECNKNFCIIMGASKEKLIGFDTIKSLRDEKMRSAVSSALSGKEGHYEGQYLSVTGGVTSVISGNFGPIISEDGSVAGIIGIFEDISERRRAEQMIKSSLHEKEILLKEIHHRVKNNMQIISSLLSLQANSIKDPDTFAYFIDAEKRIRSMALVHEKLYQTGNFTDINFGEYIKTISSEINRSFMKERSGIDLKFNVSDVTLNINKAIPCGLIINELITNIYKHAFPENRNGKIVINFKLDVNGSYNLSIIDNGIGLPHDFDMEKSESLGLKLVDALSKQLNGKIELKGNGGTSVTITFPSEDE